MKSINGQLSVHTGETFTIDFTFVNSDGSPYIISKNLSNPYFLVSIASNKYREESNYLLNYWAKLNFIPRFENTNCISLISVDNTYLPQNGDWNGNGGTPIVPLPSGYNTIGSYLVNGVRSYFANKAVLYYEDEDGNTTYKYWLYDANPNSDPDNPDYSGHWVDYDLRLVKNFTQDVTKEWTNGTYFYSITIVSGNEMIDYLRGLCTANNIPFEQTDTVNELYELLIANGYVFPEDFNLTRPIYEYDAVYPLIAPTALMVLASLNGDI